MRTALSAHTHSLFHSLTRFTRRTLPCAVSPFDTLVAALHGTGVKVHRTDCTSLPRDQDFLGGVIANTGMMKEYLQNNFAELGGCTAGFVRHASSCLRRLRKGVAHGPRCGGCPFASAQPAEPAPSLDAGYIQQGFVVPAQPVAQQTKNRIAVWPSMWLR